MSEKQSTLALTLDDKPVALVINRATARVGVNRYLIASKGMEANKTDTDTANGILRVTLYPDLTSATEIKEGLSPNLTFEEFIELPEEFVNTWAEEVYKMNPHWRPEMTSGDENNEGKNSLKKPLKKK